VRNTWTNLHGDITNSDEIERAIGPALDRGWTTEQATFNPTGPVIDKDGFLYFSPFVPYEDVVLISLDPSDGSRRWSISNTTGAPPGSSTPMVLDDPSNPGEQIIYLVLYDRAIAVEPDGTIVWDVATGLTQTGVTLEDGVIGTNYVPQIDAIGALTVNGNVFLLDRATGAQLMAAPLQLPGEKSTNTPLTIDPQVLADAEVLVQALVDLPSGSFEAFVKVLLGRDVEVANMFSVDPNTGRLWIAATAPDGEDGSVDGVSDFGALYGLDIAPAGGGLFTISEACHAYFDGGSASTPALKADGSRVYVGDNFGELLAISGADCTVDWSVDVGQLIVGSIAVSSDNDVLYAGSRDFITQVFDNGASGSIGWVVTMSGLFNGLGVLDSEFNLNLTSIGANGLGFQAGAGVVVNGTPLATAVGVGVLDRDTGAVRHFTPAIQETVAVMTAGADGAIYLGNSPVRVAFAIAAGLSFGTLTGGISKFDVERHDLLAGEAACAAADRARNADTNIGICADSAEADGAQVRELIAQIRDHAAPSALAKGEISQDRWDRADATLTAASAGLDDFLDNAIPAGLTTAADALDDSCAVLHLSSCPDTPAAGCRAAGKSIVHSLKKGGGLKDKLSWKWLKGASTSLAEFSNPASDADYSLCVYQGVAADLVADLTVPASATKWKPISTKGFKYKDKTGEADGVQGVLLKESASDKALVKVKGKGLNLPDPVLPFDTPLVVQMTNRESGLCVAATFEASGVIKSEAAQFKAKSP
jgi:hypothetical protein